MGCCMASGPEACTVGSNASTSHGGGRGPKGGQPRDIASRTIGGDKMGGDPRLGPTEPHRRVGAGVGPGGGHTVFQDQTNNGSWE